VQDLGSSEIFPAYLKHNSNGRFVVVCGDGEYVIYTALAWRNRSFGKGAEFVWAAESNDFAVRETRPDLIKVFKNFKVCHFVAPGAQGRDQTPPRVTHT
jgi:coatomer subunit beta'